MTDSKPITIYGLPLSTCTQSVGVALQELGLPYKVIDVDLKSGAHKAPDYVATKHPFGQIPVLVSSFYS